MKKGSGRFLIAAELALGMAVVVLMFLMFREGPPAQRVAVILTDSESGAWASFRAGVKAAAADRGLSVVFVNTEGMEDGAGLRAVVWEAYADGAQALLVQPPPGDEAAAALQEAAKRIPVLLVQSACSSDTGLFCVAADGEAMGRALAAQMAEDYGGALAEKTIGILGEEAPNATEQAALCGLCAGLAESGGRVLWTRGVPPREEEAAAVAAAAPYVDLAAALTTRTLELAGACAEDKSLRGTALYGIAASEKAYYYLDHEFVRGLIVPDGFAMGYRSLGQLADALAHPRRRTAALHDERTAWRPLRRKELFDEENQELLFAYEE